jgi:hypothetical protein
LPDGAGTTGALAGFMINSNEIGRAKLTLTLAR